MQDHFTETTLAMDTVCSMEAWTSISMNDRKDRPRGQHWSWNTVLQQIHNIDWDFSVTSEKSKVNKLNTEGSVKLTEQEALMIARVLELSEETGGLLDPCIYPVTRAWGFTTGENRVPADGEIAEALTHIGAHNLHLDGLTLTIDPGAQMDLGAVAKGWAGQRCEHMLNFHEEVEGAILYFGGNVQTYQGKPDGEPWRIGIQDPDNLDDIIGVLELNGTWSVVTSGDYQRYFEEDGVRYCHIMDPRTGAPAKSGLRSVTVVCKDCLDADCLSTALYIMGLADGWAWLQEHPGYEAVWVTEDRGIYVTPGLENALTKCEFKVMK